MFIEGNISKIRYFGSDLQAAKLILELCFDEEYRISLVLTPEWLHNCTGIKLVVLNLIGKINIVSFDEKSREHTHQLHAIWKKIEILLELYINYKIIYATIIDSEIK